MTHFFTKHRSPIIFLAFLIVVFAAFLYRSAIAADDVAALKTAANAPFAPFLVESAVMYSYINRFADGEEIAGTDARLGGMENYFVSEQMSLGLEYFLGGALRLRRMICGTPEPGEYEQSYVETEFIRTVFTGWIALGCGLCFLLLLALNVPLFWSLVGAGMQIVAPAAVARYTGQDLLKGPFAMTVIIACFLLVVLALKKNTRVRLALVFLLTSASLALWDMAQVLLALIFVWEIFRVLIFGGLPSRKHFNVMLMMYIGFVFAAFCNPYQNAHALLLSPTVLFAPPAAVAVNCLSSRTPLTWRMRLLGFLIVGLLGVIAWSVATTGSFGENYSHFTTLLEAKIRFLNVKPEDPALLNFEQRVLWTPELHSADYGLFRVFFPAFWLGGIVVLFFAVCFRRSRAFLRMQLPFFLPFFLFAIGFTAAFWLFVRFHVFAAPCIVIATVIAFAAVSRALPRRWLKLLLAVFAVLLFIPEIRVSYGAQREYSPQIEAQAELIAYLRQFDFNGRLVLAPMDLECLLLGYTDAGILLQPKFELPEVRKCFEEYLRTLYREPEGAFAAFCARNRCEFFLFPRGSAREPLHIYNYRYMADAKEIPRNSALYKMDFAPQRLEFFSPIPFPAEFKRLERDYILFRLLPSGGNRSIVRKADQAVACYRAQKFKEARELARNAYFANPNLEKNYLAYYQVFGEIPPEPSLSVYLSMPDPFEVTHATR